MPAVPAQVAFFLGVYAALAARLAPYLPFGTVVFAAFVPLAAGLYLLTTTAWTAAERWYLYREPARAGTGAAATA